MRLFLVVCVVSYISQAAPIDMPRLLSAISTVESSNNSSAANPESSAVGSYQILSRYVADVNRILILRKSSVRFSLQDRTDNSKAGSMVKIYVDFYASRHIGKKWKESEENLERIILGHRFGFNSSKTSPRYVRRVMEEYRSAKASRG